VWSPDGECSERRSAHQRSCAWKEGRKEGRKVRELQPFKEEEEEEEERRAR
jgi:hypothetical protein